MKVISGFLKGRKIKGYDIEGTRPTMDRVKESVFGSIQNYIPGSIVLDLFAGSGNLGIEAISNGAKYGYFVDNQKKAYQVIIDNIRNFQIEKQCRVMLCDYRKALKYYRDYSISFDIIFVDPPYRYQIVEDILYTVLEYGLLNSNGILVLEFQYDKLLDTYDGYICIKQKRFGDKFVYIFRKLID